MQFDYLDQCLLFNMFNSQIEKALTSSTYDKFGDLQWKHISSVLHGPCKRLICFHCRLPNSADGKGPMHDMGYGHVHDHDDGWMRKVLLY